MGGYLTLDNTYSIDCVVGGMKQRLHGTVTMVAGDLKSNIMDPEGNRWDKVIVAAQSNLGL